jgi:type IV secretion system protein VirB9
VRNLLLLLAAGAALALAGPLAAQVRPKPGPGDPHIQTVDYAPNQVVLLQGASGYQVTVELSPDEQVETVAVGDSSAWQVTANRRGDHLFVKAMAGGVSTNMTVITNVRLYNFELAPVGSIGDMAYTVKFKYPPAAAEDEDQAASASGEGRYRLGGDKTLRPSEMSDDGTHTYIRWPRDRALPAVYSVTDGGQEMLVNGMMRQDDVFVVDSVWKKLVFRIDDHVATATRATAIH